MIKFVAYNGCFAQDFMILSPHFQVTYHNGELSLTISRQTFTDSINHPQVNGSVPLKCSRFKQFHKPNLLAAHGPTMFHR